MPKAAAVPGRGSILLPQLVSTPVCVYFVILSSLLKVLQHSHNDKSLLNKMLSIHPAYQLVFMTRRWGCQSINTGQFFLGAQRGNTNMQISEY